MGTERPASETWRAEPRPEPDSGNPTVRDRRGALGNVVYGGTHRLDDISLIGVIAYDDVLDLAAVVT